MALPVDGQTSVDPPVDPPVNERFAVAREPLARQQPPGVQYALVVGIDVYSNLPANRQLRNAVNDAEAVAARLQDEFGFQVTFLKNEQAGSASIRAALGQLRATARSQDSVLVFFAGHGDNSADRQVGYLLPHDAAWSAGATRAALASDAPPSWLKESEIVDEFARKMQAQFVLLIFDACYAGTTFRNDIQMGSRDDQVLKALVAGAEDQPVLDGGGGNHSVFTRVLLDGLDGWAEAGQSPNGIVTASELITYVQNDVPWRCRSYGREQNPQGGSLQGSKLKDDFEFRPVKPRLPAPLLRDLYSDIDDVRVSAATELGRFWKADSPDLVQRKASELLRLIREDKALTVQVQAIRSLGQLGSASGGPTLMSLLRSEDAALDLRTAAALALGDLVQNVAEREPPDIAGSCREQALQALIDTCGSDNAALLEAAKLGLGHSLESSNHILKALPQATPRQRRQLVDALAALANGHPEEMAPIHPQHSLAWPSLSATDTFWRRVFLARRRLQPQWPQIRQQAVRLSMAGAFGLGLAYVFGIADPRWNSKWVYFPAVFSYSFLVGMPGGAAMAVLAALVGALYKMPGKSAAIVAGVVAGMCLGLSTTLSNWFLKLGNDLPAWVLSGLISGAVLGLGLALVYRQGQQGAQTPGRPTDPGNGQKASPRSLLVMALVGAVSVLIIRNPYGFILGSGDPWLETALWGVGGAILGILIARGWAGAQPAANAAD